MKKKIFVSSIIENFGKYTKYDKIIRHKKTRFHPFSGKYILEGTIGEGGVELTPIFLKLE